MRLKVVAAAIRFLHRDKYSTSRVRQLHLILLVVNMLVADAPYQLLRNNQEDDI